MAKTLFKGIQQVTMSRFNEITDKKGYLWFVREPQGEDSNLGDDRFYIYFGTKCYGSFLQGELPAMAEALNAIKESIGLDENFKFSFEGKTTVAEAFAVVKGWYDGISESLNGKADKSELVKFVDGATYADKTITFKNGETELFTIDATPFIKDGMLSDVEVVTIVADEEGNVPEGTVAGEKYIKFTWNTDGSEKVDYVLASAIGATYTPGEGIAISESNVVSISAVASEKINVNSIPVGGTPLADILLENDITSIEAGNLQAVLEALFSQNKWAANPTRTIPSNLTVSMSSPSISYDKTGTLEVGTTVKLSASAKTASASAKVEYSGFEYGYATELNGTVTDGNPSSVTITGTQVEGSNYKLSFVTNDGFNDVDVADVTGSTTSNNELIVEEGTNKVTVTATAPSFSATVGAQDAIYAASSLGRTDAEHVVAASESTTIESTAKTATNNASVTGAYKLYVGASASKVADSDGIKGLASTNWTNGATAVSFAGGTFPAGQYATIAMPSAWSLKEVKNGMDLVITDNFATVDTIEYVLPDGSKVDYKVYSNLYGADVAYNSIKIGK